MIVRVRTRQGQGHLNFAHSLESFDFDHSESRLELHWRALLQGRVDPVVVDDDAPIHCESRAIRRRNAPRVKPAICNAHAAIVNPGKI